MNVSCVSVSVSSLDFEAKNGESLVSFLALVVSFGEFFVSVGEFDARVISPYRYIAIWAKKRAGFWEILSEVGECGWEWQSWLVVHEAEPRVRAYPGWSLRTRGLKRGTRGRVLCDREAIRRRGRDIGRERVGGARFRPAAGIY